MFSKKDYFQQKGYHSETLIADLATEVWQMTLTFWKIWKKSFDGHGLSIFVEK